MPVFHLLELQDAYEDSRRWNPILRSGALIQTKKPPPNTETATSISDSLKPKRFPDFHHDIGSTLRYDPSNNDAEYGGNKFSKAQS